MTHQLGLPLTADPTCGDEMPGDESVRCTLPPGTHRRGQHANLEGPTAYAWPQLLTEEERPGDGPLTIITKRQAAGLAHDAAPRRGRRSK